MSGYRDVPPREGRGQEELPDFRPKGIERALQVAWACYLLWPVVYVLRDREVGNWQELREELVFWIELSPGAFVLFLAWWLLRRFRGEDREARGRYERSEPRFDPPRRDVRR